MTTKTLPSGTGVVSTYTYDNADRLTGISHVKGGTTTLASVAYTLDDVGNRTQRVDQQGTHTYEYDDLYRLTEVTYPGPATTEYTFDAFGNRLTMTNAAGTTDYTYDDADRLTEVDGPSTSPVTYTWDDNGSLTARGSDSFGWDYEERMTSATVNSVTTTFAYRGDGLRDSRTTGANTTTFTWDIAAGLPVVIDDGARYVYGAGLESQVSGSSTYYYLADGLGSTMNTVDASGNVVNSYTYDVYGKKTTSSGSQSNEFDFAGQQTDPTGLQYLRARYMDPETGVFLSREPLGISPTWLANHYGYVGANPAAMVDPSGLQRCDPDPAIPCEPGTPIVRDGSDGPVYVLVGSWIYDNGWQLCFQPDPRVVQPPDPQCGPWNPSGADIEEAVIGVIGAVVPLVGEYGHAAAQIASGHAYQKHVIDQGEFGNITRSDFAKHIQKVMQGAKGANKRSLKRDRTAYWDDASGTVVIRDPHSVDGGTALRPKDGRAYFEDLD
jgi:RHS repeat-associated protein